MARRRDLVRLLEQAGFTCKHGSNHDKYTHPDGRRTVVPRHDEIADGLARVILRQAGLR